MARLRLLARRSHTLSGSRASTALLPEHYLTALCLNVGSLTEAQFCSTAQVRLSQSKSAKIGSKYKHEYFLAQQLVDDALKHYGAT